MYELISICLVGIGLILFFVSLALTGRNSSSIGLLSAKTSSILLVLASIFLVLGDLYPEAIICLFQSLNSARLYFKQLAKPVTAATVTFVLLLFVLLLTYVVSFFSYATVILIGIAVILLLIITLLKNIFTMRLSETVNSHIDWPTLSLLVPARNEDHALKEMLTNLLALDYPKLEIIVLDDCSHDRTPEIISSFARDGIRFIPGTPPDKDWIGKNHAMQSLLKEASGQYSIFCDVDIRLKPDSLNAIIKAMIDQKLLHLSIIPTVRGFDLLPNMLPSLLDYWNLGLPFRFNYTKANGSIFCVNTEEFKKLGGFNKVANEIIPESVIAKFYKNTQTRTLLDLRLGVTSRKRLSSIIDTQIRNIYPLLRKEPAYIAAVLSILIILGGKVMEAGVSGDLLSVVLVVLLSLSYLIFIAATNPANLLLSLVLFPVLLVTQAILAVVSMVKYELGQVEWKQRNICYPDLEHIPELPKI